jgi:signal transduction histidine kinase
MQGLIKDLLAYFQVKNAETKYEKTDLNMIAAQAIADFDEIIKEKKGIITTKGLCEINVIPFQFRQLFHNLLANALKFSHPDRHPRIVISCETAIGKKLGDDNLLAETNYHHLSFTDNGIGFDAKYQQRIFEAFQRLHEYGEYKGTGIGLAICKKIIDNHKGHVTATGKVNKGARFDIYLPVL